MRRATLLTIVSSLICGLVAVAVAQDGEPLNPLDPRQPNQPVAQPDAPARSPEDRERRERVIASVGETIITVGEVEDAINEQSPFVRARYEDPEQLQQFVQSMVRFELLARAAERAEVGDQPEVLHVVKQNSVQQLIRRDFDERITVDNVPQADVQSYYDAHPDEFMRAELRRAAHIRVGSREEAERLLTKARTVDSREFREMAREHSTDPATNLRGGDLRYFDEEGAARNARDPQIDQGLARGAFLLEEVGDVASEPVPVGEHWSVLKLTGRRPEEHRTIDQAAPTIRLRLWRQSRQEALEQFVARLRREAGVENVDYELLRAIRLDQPEREDDEVDEDHPGAPPPASLEAIQEPDEPTEE